MIFISRIGDGIKKVGGNIKSKIPHGRRTADIKNETSRAVVQSVKDLQKLAEELARLARKAKQDLKNHAGVEDTGALIAFAKGLFGASKNTLFNKHTEMAKKFAEISAKLGLDELTPKLNLVVQKETAANRAGKRETVHLTEEEMDTMLDAQSAASGSGMV